MSSVAIKEFTFSDLSRHSGDILDIAMVEPVSLVKSGKVKVVMMPLARYEHLLAGRGMQRAFTLLNVPEADIENLVNGFQQILDEASAPNSRTVTPLRPV